ncbi:retrovirus-related pol polyprotein from transposon TNT 1-94 [Tanacetum coccineum]
MSSMQEDIQCAGSDTRPPMLDRTDFESWQQRIRLYCLGKDNGENIMKSIKEGPFHMGTVSDVIAGGTEGAVQQGPVRARVLNDLSAEEKERYKADIRATNILLQGIPKDIYSLINHYTDAKDIWENVKMILEGSELTKDDRESQLYDEFEHFRQNKGETIQGYYVRFTKLINDMRNIKMTMPRMQLNSKFVNNMLPEWSRFITEVKLNRGLKESNFDQLYAYLKQHEVHANENRIMMERFIQPNNDPLALVSDASAQQYPTQSSKSPQSSKEPYPADNFQLDSGSSSTENLIESLSNSLALLTQSYKSHLPQTNNQLRASSNARNKAMVQDGKVVVQDVRGRYNANNQGRPFQRNNARGNGVAGNVGGQNRGGIINPGQAKPIKCYNCNGLGHIARELLDEEQSLFLAGEQVTNVDDDVDDSPENDLALNVDHVFEADECDAFDSDVDEGPITQTMFMTNLTSEDLIYDEAGTSYDSNTPSEYMEDNEYHVVQRDVSSVRNDTLMSILDEMHEQGTSYSANTQKQNATKVQQTIPCDSLQELNDSTVTLKQAGSKPRSNTKKNRICLLEGENMKEVMKYTLGQIKEADLETKRPGMSDNSCTRPSGFGKQRENYLQILVINGTTRKETRLRNLIVVINGRHTGKDICLMRNCHLTKLSVEMFTLFANQQSVPRTPQQNGVVERRNRTLIEAARTMMIFSKAPMFLWAEAVATACYTQNRSLIHTRHNKTPYELVHDKKPDLTFFRVFGALCYPTNDSEDLGKFQAKADIGIFVGSGPEPFIMTPGQLKSGLALTDKELEMLFQPMFDEHLEQSRVNEPVPSATEINAQVVPPGTSLSTTIAQDAPSLSASSKQLASDALWCCFHTELSKVEPKNFKMVVIEDCWFQAMQDEIYEFDHLEVWELVPRPIYVMVIALKWIYKVKLDEYGDVLKNKARLVAKGYRQEEGIDFEESFALVA